MIFRKAIIRQPSGGPSGPNAQTRPSGARLGRSQPRHTKVPPTMGIMKIGRLDPIMGYTWRGEVFCPGCAANAAAVAFTSNATTDIEARYGITPDDGPTYVLMGLRAVLEASGDIRTNNPSEFPQAVRPGDPAAEDYCARCRAALLRI